MHPKGSESAAGGRSWFVEVTNPDGETLVHALEGDDVSIGRAPDNGLQLPDESLSRHHAVLVRTDDQLFYEDLGSRNGSFLNGLPVESRSPLHPGDHVRLGNTDLVVRHRASVELRGGSPPPETTAVFDVTDLIETRGTDELFEDVRDENRALALVSRAGTALIAHQPLKETLDEVLDLALDGLLAERAAVALIPDPDGEPEVAAARGRDGPAALEVSRTVARTVVVERKAVSIVDVQADPRVATAQSLRVQGVTSLMCAPLWDGNSVSGLLYVDRRIGHGSYGESDLKVLSMLANVLAVKLENARLLDESLARKRLEEELAVAHRIQQRLLPTRAPDHAGVAIHGVCRACTEVGGDFYDHFPVAGGAHALIVADVCGKGVGGALLAASLQAALRGGGNVEASPAQRMRWLNEFIHEHSPSDRYISAFYVEIDPTGDRIVHVSAGHPPALLITADGETCKLDAGGYPLGLFPDAEYESGTSLFQPGDRLVLYTDGLTEAAPAGAREPVFGSSGLLDAVRRSAPAPDVACEEVFAALMEATSHAPLRDDATLVIATRMG